MWRRSKTVAAFTLLECLIGLLILSGGVLLFDGMTRLLVQEIHYQERDSKKEWLVFSQQLGLELEGTSLTKVEGNRLYVDKSGQALAFGLSKSDDFRKTNAKGQGYQPMIYGLKSVQVSLDGQVVQFHFVFKNGLERTFLYDFSEKS